METGAGKEQVVLIKHRKVVIRLSVLDLKVVTLQPGTVMALSS